MKPASTCYLERIWYGGGPAPAWLRMLEHVYSAAGRNTWKRSDERPPMPVIVVGNLVAGGSGKTPAVEALAIALDRAGISPAIISRGYGGRAHGRPLKVAVDMDAQTSGDEALLLARNTRLPVWICRKRRLAMNAALEAGADVVISDDGLQHPDLPRSLEICVIDGSRRFGNGRLLPAGPLRQPITRLADVDYVLVKQTPGCAALASGEYPLRLVPERLVRVRDGAEMPPDGLAPGPVDALAGIANPESFFRTLEDLGYEIRRHPMPDHQRHRASDFDGLHGPVVVTSKDAVKLIRSETREDLWALEVRPDVDERLVRAVIGHVKEYKA